MKKTIDLSREALAIYDKWGYKKSENVSQAIIEFEQKDTVSLENRVSDLEKQVKELKDIIERK
ncbi:MAG: hypothetical protein N3I35_06810 [Clostridia bacterium]|nr:hypothetical protein [Clostridia bacterium]